MASPMSFWLAKSSAERRGYGVWVTNDDEKEMLLQVYEDGTLGPCELFGFNTGTFSTISKQDIASELNCIPSHLKSDVEFVVLVPQDGSNKKLMPLCDVIYTAYKSGIPVIQVDCHSLEQKKVLKAHHALQTCSDVILVTSWLGGIMEIANPFRCHVDGLLTRRDSV